MVVAGVELCDTYKKTEWDCDYRKTGKRKLEAFLFLFGDQTKRAFTKARGYNELGIGSSYNCS